MISLAIRLRATHAAASTWLQPLAVVGILFAGAWLIVALLAPWLSPYDPLDQGEPDPGPEDHGEQDAALLLGLRGRHGTRGYRANRVYGMGQQQPREHRRYVVTSHSP